MRPACSTSGVETEPFSPCAHVSGSIASAWKSRNRAAKRGGGGVNVFGSLDRVAETHPPGSFHAVALLQVLEHLTRPLDVLRALRKLVADGGVLMLETPDCGNVTDIRTRRDYELINPLGHINAFTPETLERIAKEAGFSRIRPCTVQVCAGAKRAYKREVRRLLSPFLRDGTQQMFLAD